MITSEGKKMALTIVNELQYSLMNSMLVSLTRTVCFVRWNHKKNADIKFGEACENERLRDWSELRKKKKTIKVLTA